MKTAKKTPSRTQSLLLLFFSSIAFAAFISSLKVTHTFNDLPLAFSKTEQESRID